MQNTALPNRQPAASGPAADAPLYSRNSTTLRASLLGLAAMIGLALAILLGSRMLAYFDPALTGYAIATLFSAFAIAFHYGTWLMRSSTCIMWRRSWQF